MAWPWPQGSDKQPRVTGSQVNDHKGPAALPATWFWSLGPQHWKPGEGALASAPESPQPRNSRYRAVMCGAVMGAAWSYAAPCLKEDALRRVEGILVQKQDP